jgi:hypothetical protein
MAKMQTRASDASDGVKRSGNTSTQLGQVPKGETRRAGRADPEKAEGAELTPKSHSVRLQGLVKRTPGQQKNGEHRVNPRPQHRLRTTKKMVC